LFSGWDSLGQRNKSPAKQPGFFIKFLLTSLHFMVYILSMVYSLIIVYISIIVVTVSTASLENLLIKEIRR